MSTLISATSLTFSLETLSGGAPCRMPDSLSSWCTGCVDRHSSHFAHIVPSWSLGSTVQIMLFLRKSQVCPGQVLVPQVWGEEGRRALASLASLPCSANCLLTECWKSDSDGGRKITPPQDLTSLQLHREHGRKPAASPLPHVSLVKGQSGGGGTIT